MYSKKLALALLASVFSLSAWAEPAIQPGDTIESLSKVKITTSIHAQSSPPSNLPTNQQSPFSDPANPEQPMTAPADPAVPPVDPSMKPPTEPEQTPPQHHQHLLQSGAISEENKLEELPSSAEQPVNQEAPPEQQSQAAATSQLEKSITAQP